MQIALESVSMWTYCKQFLMWLHVSSGQDQQLQSASKTPGYKETVLPPNTATLWSVSQQTSCRPISGKESSSETTSAQKFNCPSRNARDRTYLEAESDVWNCEMLLVFFLSIDLFFVLLSHKRKDYDEKF